MIAIVKYQVATYSGQVEVYFEDPDTENEMLIAKAKKILTRQSGFLPLGYQSFRVVSRSE